MCYRYYHFFLSRMYGLTVLISSFENIYNILKLFLFSVKRTGSKITKSYEWKCRELEDDCISDAISVKNQLIESLENRKECINQCSFSLSKCLDFGSLFDHVTGSQSYDIIKLAYFGRNEFFKLVEYVAAVPHIVTSKLAIDPIMATNIHDRIKSCFASIV